MVRNQHGSITSTRREICRRHDIPRRHGKKVTRPLLPRLDAPELRSITIPAGPTGEDSREQEKPRGKAAEPQAENKIVVPQVLASPHPLVQRTEKSLRKAKPDERGLVQPTAKRALNISVAPDRVDRALRIMDALVKALDDHSYRVSSTIEDRRRHTVAEVDGERIEFQLTEHVKREERKPTPEERGERKRWPLLYHGPLYRHIPTGRLSLQIKTECRCWCRRKWSDGKRQRVEGGLNGFIESLSTISESLKQRRREREEERRKHEAWERERVEKLRLIAKEEKRVKQLEAQVDAWHQSQRIRVFVQAVEEAASDRYGQLAEDDELTRWISWARDQADRVAPTAKSPPCILDERSKWHIGRSFRTW